MEAGRQGGREAGRQDFEQKVAKFAKDGGREAGLGC
jgi:hypothetical protein